MAAGVHQSLAGNVIGVHGEPRGGHQEIDAAVQQFLHPLADGPAIVRHDQGFQNLTAEFLHLGADDGDEFILHQPHEDLGAGYYDADPGLAQGEHPEQGPVAQEGHGFMKVGAGQKQGNRPGAAQHPALGEHRVALAAGAHDPGHQVEPL